MSGDIVKIVSSEKGFLGLNFTQKVTVHKPQAFIIPFGYEDKEDSGCGAGPEAIIAASRDINLFDERYGCHPYQHIAFTTLKEIYLTNSSRQAWQTLQRLQETFCKNQQFSLILGGENRLLSSSLGPWLTTSSDVAFIHLGAHGSIIHELGSNYPGLTLLGFGLRSIDASLYQLALAQGSRISLYYAKDRHHWDWAKISACLRGKKVYLSVSVDCFDMSLLPATPLPEPGGLSWDEVMTSIEFFAHNTAIIGASLCDFAPIENMPIYDLLVAKFAYRLVSTIFLCADFSLK